MARYTEYTDVLGEIICARLSDGETLRQICKDENMPAYSTVVKWTNQFPAFRDLYASARSLGLDVMAEDIVQISEDREDDSNSRRVRIDARKWLLSKMRPEKYSDRLAITGAKDAEPLRVVVQYDDKAIPE